MNAHDYGVVCMHLRAERMQSSRNPRYQKSDPEVTPIFGALYGVPQCQKSFTRVLFALRQFFSDLSFPLTVCQPELGAQRTTGKFSSSDESSQLLTMDLSLSSALMLFYNIHVQSSCYDA